MPALPVIANCARVTLNWVVGSYTFHNVMHFGISDGDEFELFTNLDSFLDNNMFEAVSHFAELNSMDILQLDGFSATTHWNFTDPFEGAATGDAIFEAALCVALQTGIRGPQARGRVFLGPLGEGSADGSLVGAAYVAEAQTRWTNFVSAMAGTNNPLQVASYSVPQNLNVTTVRADSYMCTQRRRLLRTR